jgi:AcrR family transcriptional regulator
MLHVVPARREELIQAAVDYVFDNGVSDLSLRPLADALGTSSRMLIYHFETKDRLLVEILKAARARQYVMLEDWVAEGRTLPEIVRMYWRWATDESSKPYVRLFFEVFGMAVQGRPGTEEVLPALRRESSDLLAGVVRKVATEAESAELAALSAGVLRGLLFQWLCGDDPSLLTRSLEAFLAYITLRLESSGRGT